MKVIAFFLVIMIGVLDYWTGPQLALSIFYLFPVLMATVSGGFQAGAVFSVLSAVVWLAADLLWDTSYAQSIIPYWNTLMRLGLFLTIAFFFAKSREASTRLEEKVRDRTAVLEHEMSERQRMETQLRISEANYRDIVESAIVGVYQINDEGKILFANPALASMLEFDSPGEMQGINLLAMYENAADRSRMIRTLRDHSVVHNLEVPISTKTRKARHVIISATLHDGVVSGMIRDITEKRQLEAQLQQSQKMESLGTLAGGIAHDFNNLLGIVIGHAMLMKDTAADQTTLKKNSDAIIKAADRGTTLVRQLLTFARKSEVLQTPISSKVAAEEVLKLIRQTFPKTISILAMLDEHLPPIVVDGTQLHQVLLNLCINARDAMPDGGTLTIGTALIPGATIRSRFEKAKAAEYVLLEISDTGIGMDAETSRRVFEPFFTTKERGKGTGLGLAVVFGIMESHEGFIDLKTEPGNGTTFCLYFPVKPANPVSQPVVASEPQEVRGGRETILVVEDEELLAEMIKAVLVGKGYTVIMAADGIEAIQLFKKNRNTIALVLSDLGLPKLDGIGVHSTLREIDPDVKFILASGYILPEERAMALASGVKTVIQKPYAVIDLLRVMRETLQV